MKNFKMIFLLVATLALGFTITACGSGGQDHEHSEEAAEMGMEYTSAYVCPMHCEGSGSAEAGKCPVCGMDYVVNEDHKADGHEHDDHDHDGDDHDGHEH